jgi:hypothetical protein
MVALHAINAPCADQSEQDAVADVCDPAQTAAARPCSNGWSACSVRAGDKRKGLPPLGSQTSRRRALDPDNAASQPPDAVSARISDLLRSHLDSVFDDCSPAASGPTKTTSACPPTSSATRSAPVPPPSAQPSGTASSTEAAFRLFRDSPCGAVVVSGGDARFARVLEPPGRKPNVASEPSSTPSSRLVQNAASRSEGEAHPPQRKRVRRGAGGGGPGGVAPAPQKRASEAGVRGGLDHPPPDHVDCESSDTSDGHDAERARLASVVVQIAPPDA